MASAEQDLADMYGVYLVIRDVHITYQYIRTKTIEAGTIIQGTIQANRQLMTYHLELGPILVDIAGYLVQLSPEDNSWLKPICHADRLAAFCGSMWRQKDKLVVGQNVILKKKFGLKEIDGAIVEINGDTKIMKVSYKVSLVSFYSELAIIG